MNENNFKILAFVIIDILLLIFGFINFPNLENRAKLPDDFYLKVESFSFIHQKPVQKYTAFMINNNIVSNINEIKYFLSYFKNGDTVRVKYLDKTTEYSKKIVLERDYTQFEVISKVFITMLYFFTGIFILIKFKCKSYSVVFQLLCIATGSMVLFDRGTLLIYPEWINLIIWFIFDFVAFLIPSLFLHFSIIFPIDKPSFHPKLIIPSYTLSVTFSIASFYFLYQLFINSNLKYFEVYRVFQNEISDSFLIITILITAGILEHSALQIKNALERKKVYWVLLGITFGPLFYVFLILIPRVLLGYELVEQSLVEFTLGLAPLVFLIAFIQKK